MGGSTISNLCFFVEWKNWIKMSITHFAKQSNISLLSDGIFNIAFALILVIALSTILWIVRIETILW